MNAASPHAARLVIALPHARLRDAVSKALEASGAISVIARASDVADMIRMTREGRPDGVLLGTALLQGDVVDELRGLGAVLPGVRIVVIGTETSPAYGAAMEAAGAAAYVALGIGPESLACAVQRAIDP